MGTGSTMHSASDIAVVGMACRVPGARNLAEFWRNLRDGVESITQFADADLVAAGVDPAILRDPAYVKAGPVLDDLDQFDAGFFGFSPKEAAIMDPQHRQFLECAWEALEHAGHAPESFNGSIGVYTGCGLNTYFIRNLLTNAPLIKSVGMFLVRHTGNDKDFLPTRVSYLFNLKGPSLAIQTACSSSLVAIHVAAQNLLSGECDLALAGGVTIEVPHRRGYLYQEGEVLSRDGHCRAFDADASGTVFGSGAGVVVLRRLQDALADGDCIHAVVKGSAVNNDGASKVGFMAPSVDGQAEVVSEALAVADAPAGTISYVEMHGTGTIVGDPIELKALTQAFRQHAGGRHFCAVGSVKTNIGHLDTAAGVAGFIKTVLALEHQTLPPSLNFNKPNPLIDFEDSPFYVNTRSAAWHRNGWPRRAGVTSLGVGGTNAHVVLEEAPQPMAATEDGKPWQLVVLSTRSESALEAATDRLVAHLDDHPDIPLADVAYTCQRGRTAFAHRRVVVCRDNEDARDTLRQRDPKRVFTRLSERADPSVVFLFPGGGAQYPNMGLELYQTEPVYRREVDRCRSILRTLVPFDIRDVMFPAAGHEQDAAERLERPSVALPGLFATEYALAQLWLSWGIEPAAMVGHSMGEYVAACLAGVMSLENALMLVSFRGRLFERVPEGAMLSVPLPELELQALLPEALSIAAVNGPELCVVSGPSAAIGQFETLLASKDVEFQRLKISVAAHSSMLTPILDEFAEGVASLSLNRPEIPYVSNVTGAWVQPDDVRDSAYWVRHLRQTVRFGDGLAEVLKEPNQVLVEVGPGRMLTSLVRQHPLKTASHSVTVSMRHPQDSVSDVQCLLNACGQLWLAGKTPDWSTLHGDARRRRVPLPTYPFEHERYWIEPGHQVADTETPSTLVKTPDIARWFCCPTWKRADALVDPPDSSPAADPACWVVFADRMGIGSRLAEQLKARQHTVVTVIAGRTFSRKAADSYVINPEVKEDYDALIQKVVADGKRPRNFAHLWSLDAKRVDLEHLDGALGLSFFSLLFLAQAVGASELVEPLRISVVSSNIHRVDDEPLPHPELATVLGPCRVIPQEFPHITCQNIDIDLASGTLKPGRRRRGRQGRYDWLAGLLLADLTSSPNDVVAYRGAHRWIQDFAPVNLAAPSGNGGPWRDKGVYLVTGGLGAIGLALAEHLAKTVHARLVLVGRSGLPDPATWGDWLQQKGDADATSRAIRQIQALERLGADVLVCAADVSNLDQMRGVIARARRRFGDINGVIHAAGVMNDGAIHLKTRDDASRVLAPKLRGTLVLDTLLGGLPLDFFVLCSSTSSFLGLAGQIDYTAANAFLDAFATSKGRSHSVAINWGAWKDAGMAVDAARRLGYVPATDAAATVAHPLLQTCISRSAVERVFIADYRARDLWVLDEHRLSDGTALIPGTGYVELVRAALAEVQQDGRFELQDLSFLSPLQAGDDESIRVRVSVRAEGDEYDVSVASRSSSTGSEEVWLEHATCTATPMAADPPGRLLLDRILTRCTPHAPQHAHDRAPEWTRQHRHLAFGPRWNNIKEVYLGHAEAVAKLVLPDEFVSDLDGFALHPALLDMATGFALPLIEGYGTSDAFYVPLSYKRVQIYKPLPGTIFSYARLSGRQQTELAVFDVTLTDVHGEVLVEIEAFAMRRLPDGSALHLVDSRKAVTEATARAASDAAISRDSTAIPELLRLALEHGISPAEGVDAFSRILAGGVSPQVVASSIDFRRLMARVQSAARPEADASVTLPKQARPSLSKTYVAPSTRLEREIAAIWQEILGVESVGIEDSFFELGGHSLLALRLFGKLKKLTGKNLPLATLFEAPTIKQLAERLGEKEWSASWSCLVPIQPKGSRPPFFCIHGMGGNILEYLDLSRYLHPDQPFYGIQAKGLDGNEPYLTRVEDFAAHYISQIRGLQPEGPYYLGGSSFGGLVGYEIAQQLQSVGQQVALLALFDTYGRDYPKALPTTNFLRAQYTFWKLRVDLHWGNLKLLSREEKLQYARQKISLLPGRYRRRVMKIIDRLHRKFSLLFLPRVLREQFELTGEDARGMKRTNVPRAIRDVQVAITQSARKYQLRPYSDRVMLFRAARQPSGIYPDPTNGWSELVHGLEILDVPGYHGAIVREPRVKVLAEKLNECIDRARRSTSAEPGRRSVLGKERPDYSHEAAECPAAIVTAELPAEMAQS